VAGLGAAAVAATVAGLGAAAAAATVAAHTGPRPRGQHILLTDHPTTPVGGMVEEIIQNHPVPEMASALVRSKFDAMRVAMCEISENCTN